MRATIWIFLTLCTAFLGYSFLIYSAAETHDFTQQQQNDCAQGRLVWQKYNCQSCHQLYGLGGYLGPDLTNVFSNKAKDKHYFHAILRAGAKQMPVFLLSTEEEDQLRSYLEVLNQTGQADPRTFNSHPSGMIHQP